MGAVGGWLHDHDGLIALSQVALLVCLLVAAAPQLRRACLDVERWLRWTLLVLGVVAAGISAFWVPAFTAFDALGHEASYLECFTAQSMDGSGAVSPANSHGWEAFVTYPLVRWTWWLFGGLVGRESVAPLLALNIGFRALAVVCVGLLARFVTARPACGAVAALILTVHPWHAFWGAAIYNVAMPFMFASLALALAVLAWRTGSALLFSAGAAAGVLVLAARVEWAILGPSLLFLLIGLGSSWGRHPRSVTLRFWLPALCIAVIGAASVLLAGGQLTEQGGYHGIGGYLSTLARQVWILDLAEPFHEPWTLLAPLLGGVVLVRTKSLGWGPALGLWAYFGFGYLALATFNDFSYRHALLPVLGLVLLSSALAIPLTEAEGRRRVVAGVVLAVLLLSALLGLQRVATRYYLSQDEFFAEHDGFRGPMLDAAEVESGSCFLITDNERLWQQGLAGSHFNLMDPGEAVTHWRRFDGCVLWLFDNAGYRYDGLAVPPRSTKLQHWFEWQYQGWSRLAEGEVVVYRMTQPPWGIGDDQPVPATEFRLPGEADPEDRPEADPERRPDEGPEGAGPAARPSAADSARENGEQGGLGPRSGVDSAP